MTHRSYLNLVFLMALVLMHMTSGCRRLSDSDDQVVRIFSESNLEARVGKPIHWRFRADMAGRPLKVIDISASRLPFGASPAEENGERVITGTVEGRQFRTGQLTVVAFDETGCRTQLEMTAKMASKNLAGSGNPDLAVPFRECDPRKFTGIPIEAENFYYGKFTWQIVDGPDQLEIKDYAGFFNSVACVDQPSCPKGLFQTLELKPSFYKARFGRVPADNDTLMELIIPPYEAPHTSLVTLGNCAKYDRKQCGRDKDCLWSGMVCVSSETTGLTAIKNGG